MPYKASQCAQAAFSPCCRRATANGKGELTGAADSFYFDACLDPAAQIGRIELWRRYMIFYRLVLTMPTCP